MYRADVIKLISEDPQAHGMFDPFIASAREVFCEVTSVGMQEAYTAMSEGLHPTLRFRIRVAEDYADEGFLEYHGQQYRIVRTYMSGDGIELYAERVTGDV